MVWIASSKCYALAVDSSFPRSFLLIHNTLLQHDQIAYSIDKKDELDLNNRAQNVLVLQSCCRWFGPNIFEYLILLLFHILRILCKSYGRLNHFSHWFQPSSYISGFCLLSNNNFWNLVHHSQLIYKIWRKHALVTKKTFVIDQNYFSYAFLVVEDTTRDAWTSAWSNRRLWFQRARISSSSIIQLHKALILIVAYNLALHPPNFKE